MITISACTIQFKMANCCIDIQKIESSPSLNEEEEKSLAWYNKEEIKNLNLEEVWRYWFEKLKIISFL